MGLRLPLLLICLACCLAGSGGDAGCFESMPGAETDVRRDFEIILDLWRDERYDELCARTYVAGRMTRESFVRKISSADRRPACCWEMIQDVRVSVAGGEKATLTARVGIEETGKATEFCTRSFRLRREEGVWKASAADILALSRRAGGRSRYHR